MPSEAASLNVEHSLWQAGHHHVAGLDEAGRGCLAGPVVAAAVILPEGDAIAGVADSKTLSEARREALRTEIEAQAMAVGLGRCAPKEIDELNILWAALEAMRRAAEALRPAPNHLLIDGNRCFPDSPWPHDTIIKGDQKCHSIAAASIVAKTERDRFMRRLHDDHPAYGWDTNVGYPTQAHYAALEAHGPTPHHRRSFKLSRAS